MVSAVSPAYHNNPSWCWAAQISSPGYSSGAPEVRTVNCACYLTSGYSYPCSAASAGGCRTSPGSSTGCSGSCPGSTLLYGAGSSSGLSHCWPSLTVGVAGASSITISHFLSEGL